MVWAPCSSLEPCMRWSLGVSRTVGVIRSLSTPQNRNRYYPKPVWRFFRSKPEYFLTELPQWMTLYWLRGASVQLTWAVYFMFLCRGEYWEKNALFSIIAVKLHILMMSWYHPRLRWFSNICALSQLIISKETIRYYKSSLFKNIFSVSVAFTVRHQKDEVSSCRKLREN